jgi:hypothetical protein
MTDSLTEAASTDSKIKAKMSLFKKEVYDLPTPTAENPFKKIDKKLVLKLLPILILLITIPIGVYLALHPQIFNPKADNEKSTLFFIKSDTYTVNQGAKVTVSWGETAVNVQAFGATPDDDKEDTESIQSALNSGGTKIFVPKGTYKVRNLVVPNSVSEISGEASGKSTLEITGQVAGDFGPDFLLVKGVNDLTVQNLTFKGINTDDYRNTGIVLYGSSQRIKILGNKFTNLGAPAVTIAQASYVHLEGNELSNVKGAFFLKGAHNIKIASNNLHWEEDHPVTTKFLPIIALDSKDQSGIPSPYIPADCTSQRDISCQPQDVEIIGNTLSNFPNSQGILIHAGSNVAIKNNIFKNISISISANPYCDSQVCPSPPSDDVIEKIFIDGNKIYGTSYKNITSDGCGSGGISAGGSEINYIKDVTVSNNETGNTNATSNNSPSDRIVNNKQGIGGALALGYVDNLLVTGNSFSKLAKGYGSNILLINKVTNFAITKNQLLDLNPANKLFGSSLGPCTDDLGSYKAAILSYSPKIDKTAKGSIGYILDNTYGEDIGTKISSLPNDEFKTQGSLPAEITGAGSLEIPTNFDLHTKGVADADWFGLFPADGSTRADNYLSNYYFKTQDCRTLSPKAPNSCQVTIPTQPGIFEFRYFRDKTFLAKSQPIEITQLSETTTATSSASSFSQPNTSTGNNNLTHKQDMPQAIKAPSPGSTSLNQPSVSVPAQSPPQTQDQTEPVPSSGTTGLAFQRTLIRTQNESVHQEIEQLLEKRETSSPSPSPESQNLYLQTFQNITQAFTSLKDKISSYIDNELFFGR